MYAFVRVLALPTEQASGQEKKKLLQESFSSPAPTLSTGQSGGVGTKEVLEGRYSV